MVQSRAPTVAAYLREQPPEKARVLRALLAAVRRAAPGAVVRMEYGMPVARRGDAYVAVHAQTRHYSFYVSDPAVLRRHAALLRGRDRGKACVRFRDPASFPPALAERLARATLRRAAAGRAARTATATRKGMRKGKR